MHACSTTPLSNAPVHRSTLEHTGSAGSRSQSTWVTSASLDQKSSSIPSSATLISTHLCRTSSTLSSRCKDHPPALCVIPPHHTPLLLPRRDCFHAPSAHVRAWHLCVSHLCTPARAHPHACTRITLNHTHSATKDIACAHARTHAPVPQSTQTTERTAGMSRWTP